MSTKDVKDSISDFIVAVENQRRREDSEALLALMEKASGYTPYLTGNMIGFGRYHYKYDSGREGEAFVTGFSPRKQNLAIYIMPGFSSYQDILNKLGKHKAGKCCLTINKLADIDLKALEKLVHRSVKDMEKRYDCRNN